MVVILKYHNDGKEKWQSHEVYDDDFDLVDRGYGSTKKEAFANYKDNIKKYADKVSLYFATNLGGYNDFYTKEVINNLINVDCFGKQIL